MRKQRTAFLSVVVVLFAPACSVRSPVVVPPPAPAVVVSPPEAVQAERVELPRTVETPERSEDRPEPESVPTSCAAGRGGKEQKTCLVGAAYAKKLCDRHSPELALTLFAKGTPWTRAYLAGDVKAWNASGGRTHVAELVFDEEVILLTEHGAASTGGIVMTGSQATYDVLRSDGSCVSLSEGEITTRRPPAPKTTPVRCPPAFSGERALREPGILKACARGSSPSDRSRR